MSLEYCSPGSSRHSIPVPPRLRRESQSDSSDDPRPNHQGPVVPSRSNPSDGRNKEKDSNQRDGNGSSDGLRVILVPADRAAGLLGISARHFRKLDRTGLVPRPVRLGRRALWRVAELEEWVAAGCPRAGTVGCRQGSGNPRFGGAQAWGGTVRPMELEAKVLRLAERIEAKQPIEDSLVEVKAEWIDPLRAARRLAGHCNAARGSPCCGSSGSMRIGELLGRMRPNSPTGGHR
jgi:predicted DNA-binding transcriptional regulator AlpA